jgi:hypothetical protein
MTARERQQPAGRTQYLEKGAGKGEMPNAEQETEDRQVHRRRNERRHPHRHA